MKHCMKPARFYLMVAVIIGLTGFLLWKSAVKGGDARPIHEESFLQKERAWQARL